MAKLIQRSTSDDLRQPSWKMKSYKKSGGILIQTYITPDGKTLEVHTRFTGYDDAFGKPEIQYQEVYEVEGEK